MNKYIFLALAIVLGIAFLSVLFSNKPDSWKAKRLLTKNEEEFFGRLIEALPDFYVFPQVAFRAFLRPGETSSSSKAYMRQSGFIGGKHCDFLICNKALDIIAIIELDDRTHIAEKDAARDAMTASAGYPTIRYESKGRPRPARIREDVLQLAA
jgi:hypothetical protein